MLNKTGRALRRTVAVAALAIPLALAAAAPAAANDSAAELAAGGLVLVKTDGIAMQREDLTVSPSEVRVCYEMRNDTGRPIPLRVAFPLPEVPGETPTGMETSTGAHNVNMRPPTDPNFLQFKVSADGRAEATVHDYVPRQDLRILYVPTAESM